MPFPRRLFTRSLNALAAAGALHAGAVFAAPVTLDQHVKPLLKQFCADCHNATKSKGDINIEPLFAGGDIAQHRDVWEKIAEQLESGDMPPEKKPQPNEAQKQMLMRFIDGQLSQFDCKQNPNPGRVTIRRLNREEYRNTIRDLLRVEYRGEDFPNDEVGYGFDNIGDVLSLSPMLMEKYMAAAEEIIGMAIVTDPNKPQVTKVPGNQFYPKTPTSDVQPESDGAVTFASAGEAFRSVNLPAKGDYTVRVRASADQAGPELPKVALRANGKDLQVFEVKAGRKAETIELHVPLQAGWQQISLAFLNDYFDDKNPDKKLRGDRNVHIESLEFLAPPGEASFPESHRRWIPRLPKQGEELTLAREVLGKFARSAYRRPLEKAEIDRLVGLVDMAMKQKAGFLEGMAIAMQAVLTSPKFLFRWELDPPGLKPGDVRELTDVEVASRLSYFLWSSMPDEELATLAEKGELRKNGNLEKQAARMLKDWHSRQFVNNFADQWLQIRNIWEIAPDPGTFRKWQDSLKGEMKEETELFFQAIVQEDRSILELLDADFTFLNQRLAEYYGVPGVNGSKFQRVTLPAGSPRGGVLTLGSVLLTTSTPTRTSPVIRGKWILEQILGTPPPAPPADVPPLAEQKAVDQTASLRKRLEEHRNSPECANCHKRMDPLGFALEHFDATGAWRDKDGKFEIDSSGELPNGKAFKDSRDLKRVLKEGKAFPVNLTEKLLTYALGRGLDYYDRCAVQEIVKGAEKQGYKFSAVIAGIVNSEPFLKRKTEPLAQR